MVGQTMEALKVVSWNANSCIKHLNELKELIEEHKPHAVLLQETFLKSHMASPIIRGYTWHRQDRADGKGGGVAILVQNSLPFTRNAPPGNIKEAEVVGGKALTQEGEIHLASLYLPPSKGRKGEIGIILKAHQHFFIAGDLNAHWSSWGGGKDNAAGSFLDYWVNELRLNIHIPPMNTRVHPTDSTKDAVLDYAISHERLSEVYTHVLPLRGSDHRPILYKLKTLNILTPINFKLVRDWDGIERDLAEVQWPTHINSSAESVNTAASVFETEAQVALFNNSHYIRLKGQHSRLLPRPIVQLQRERARHQKAWLLNRDPATKTLINQCSHRITALVKEWEEERVAEFVTNLDNPRKRWGTFRALSDKAPRITSLRSGATTAYLDEDKAEMIANSLEARFTEHPGGAPYPPADHYQPPRPRYSLDVPRISTRNVEDALLTCKDKKAPGHDGISYQLIKLLPEDGINFITLLFNAIIINQAYPEAWKRAVVIPLSKPGKDPHDPNNYRPISLLPCLSKVFEKALLSHLNGIERALGVIPNHQMGFRGKHSTNHQLVRTAETLITAWNSRQSAFMVTLDVEAAFDRVPHQRLLYKLHYFKFPPWFISLMSAYFSNRSFMVRVGHSISADHPVAAGTPQGSILSPFLFNIYIADMPSPHPNHGIISQYADDTCYITEAQDPATAEDYMQQTLVRLERWCSTWKTKINGSKSTVMYLDPKLHNFSRQFNRPFHIDIMIDREKIPAVEETKYLGVIFDRKLKWDKHTSYVLRRAKQRTGMLHAMHLPPQRLSTATRKVLYLSLIRPIITYGVPTWLGAAVSHKNPLYQYERTWIRKIYKIPWYTKTENVELTADFPLLKSFMLTLATNFYVNTRNHINPYISSIGNYRRQAECKDRPSRCNKFYPLQITV